MRQTCFVSGFVVLFQQPGEIKAAARNQRRRPDDDHRLGAGSFEVIGQLLNQNRLFAEKNSLLPRLRLFINPHGGVIGRIRRTGPQPINHALAENSQQQHDDGGDPECPRPPIG